ncbi:unnamed protein product [Euphydryas editha]|uniref:Uncharacterized protein n=1 Tax=Euphydryas editha TaxID=104508 RepID=A0AAU9TNN9_EUPED|nr:unnamed protein product [Euphydryas editha]
MSAEGSPTRSGLPSERSVSYPNLQYKNNPSQPLELQGYNAGRYKKDENRLIKVFFEFSDIVLNILRNKSSVMNDVNKFYLDQTPQQQSYMKYIKEELDSRTKNSETNLMIKYIRSVSKIISTPSKNFNR